jgi:hypothetical protein
MNSYRSLTVLLCAAALAACEKNAVQDIAGPAPSARIKFFNFGVNAPGVNFYANDTKMTAISSTSCTTPPLSQACTTTGVESTVGVTYGNVGAGGLYSGIAPGQYTLSGRIAAATDKDLPISNLTTTIADGKNYSFYQSGVYNTATKRVDAFILEDNFPAAMDFSAAHVRFVHAIFNANPMTLYARHSVTGEEYAIGGAVAYKSGGTFVPVPNGVYALSTRYAGASTNVLTRTNVSFVAGRVYTVGARGDITVASTQLLDNTLNR